MIDQVITKVACGSNFSMALTESGIAYSWGQGKYGALGHGRSDNLNEPQPLQVENVMEISAGGQHAAVLTKNHQLYMCGDGSKG